MRIVELEALPNGAHRNQNGSGREIPAGWAVIPEEQELENFPFGEAEAEEQDGVMTLTAWQPLPVPEAEEEAADPDEEELVLDLLAEHEERICLLELMM